MLLLHSSTLAMGPASWRSELDPRGALQWATDAGRWARLNECAFNRLSVCGRWSSAQSRILMCSQHMVVEVSTSINELTLKEVVCAIQLSICNCELLLLFTRMQASIEMPLKLVLSVCLPAPLA